MAKEDEDKVLSTEEVDKFIENIEKEAREKEEKAKPKEDVEEGKRETSNRMKDLKILTAIMLGKDRNKELSKVLDTDKSFTSKQVKGLEEKGLIYKEGTGKDVRYEVNKFRALEFLQSKIVIKWKKEDEEKKEKGDEE